MKVSHPRQGLVIVTKGSDLDNVDLAGSVIIDVDLSKSKINDDIILRPVIANPEVTRESLEQFVLEVVTIGDEIIRGIPSNY